MKIEILPADYLNTEHAHAIGFLLNAYATDPMGGGRPLPENVVTSIANKLSAIDYAVSIIGYVDGEPAGLVNCFEGFSTFLCAPLLNIHDIFVLKKYRGIGLSQALLGKVEEIAKARGCCKLTLEVLSKNTVAQSSYRKFGFTGYELDPEIGKALFWQKSLTSV